MPPGLLITDAMGLGSVDRQEAALRMIDKTCRPDRHVLYLTGFLLFPLRANSDDIIQYLW